MTQDEKVHGPRCPAPTIPSLLTHQAVRGENRNDFFGRGSPRGNDTCMNLLLCIQPTHPHTPTVSRQKTNSQDRGPGFGEELWLSCTAVATHTPMSICKPSPPIVSGAVKAVPQSRTTSRNCSFVYDIPERPSIYWTWLLGVIRVTG